MGGEKWLVKKQWRRTNEEWVLAGVLMVFYRGEEGGADRI
jgi:hypothetical protein